MDEVTPELRLERLRRLYDVVKLHADADGEPVKLNGEVLSWNMYTWGCRSAACAMGSYVLTPYGKEYFGVSVWGPYLLEGGSGNPYLESARHFGIDKDDAKLLFMPQEYDFDESEDIPPDVVLERIDELIARYEEDSDAD